MRPLDLPRKADGARIQAVANHYVKVMPWVYAIRQSYGFYHAKKAVGLNVAGLDDDAKAAMHLAYASKAKVAKLDWIEDLQTKHSLHHCPLCGGLGARTIEHHLPQSNYPEFAIFGPNLIPSCNACNGKRGATANGPGVKINTLHPYYDHDILKGPLVYVSVLKPWAAPRFKLRRLPIADTDVRRRVTHHLKSSVDGPSFETWIRGRWGDFRAKIVTDHTTVPGLIQALEKSLAIDHAGRNHNSWDAALTRGVLQRPSLLAWLLANQLPVPTFPRATLGY